MTHTSPLLLRLARHATAIGLALSVPATVIGAGCSLLGTAAGVPEGLPHAGVGPYRDLLSSESGLAAPGIPVSLRNIAAERPMQAGLHLFYAGAAIGTPMPDAGMPDAGPLDGGDLDAGSVDAGVADAGSDAGRMDAGVVEVSDDVDWSRFPETRRIYRSPPRQANWGYDPGSVVLAPEGGPAWEGGYVTEPWGLVTEDGALLYYAAEGGIGVARASGIDGTFTRVGTAPIFAGTGAEVPRCPSVVRTDELDDAPSDAGMGLFDEGYYMVYELSGALHAATSSDGISFTDHGVIMMPPIARRDRRDGTERAVGCPGIAIAQPTTGRHILRVYYESRRDNDATLIGLMATLDGVNFDFHPIPVISAYDRRMPAPRVIDSRLSILFHWGPDAVRGISIGQLRVGMAPGGAELPGGTF
jgi:hypothetical protein